MVLSGSTFSKSFDSQHWNKVKFNFYSISNVTDTSVLFFFLNYVVYNYASVTKIN